MEIRFNPFKKPFGEVEEKDLSILKNIAEGWNVEYKEERQNPKRISKSISSFANSHGGVYFLGIAADKTNNYAKEFIGVEDSPDIIRDSVRGHVQPFPLFESYDINLSNGKKIIMVVIPDGDDPPYICDGMVYRRQGAGSDPIPETDRYTLDKLYEKSKEFKNKIERFRTSEFSFCQGEMGEPRLEIYINPKPFNHFSIGEDLFKEDEREKLLSYFNNKSSISINDNTYINVQVNFDTLNTYHSSIVIRQVNNNDLSYNGLTIEIDKHGNCRMSIPIYNNIPLNKLDKKYIEIINGRKGGITLLDGQNIFEAVFCLINKFINFLFNKNYKDIIEVKCRLHNCYRVTLFFTGEKFFEHINKFNIPICMKEEQYFPEKPIEINVDKFMSYPLGGSGLIFSYIGMALGIPYDISTTIFVDNLLNKDRINRL